MVSYCGTHARFSSLLARSDGCSSPIRAVFCLVLSRYLGQVGLERQGLTGCQGPNVGGVTPQNERMQEILRMTQGLDPMQVLRLRQVLGEQVNQVRGVPELFGQRGDGMFPYGTDPMHVPGSGGEYSMDVFSKSERWLGSPPVPDTGKWSSRE